MPETLRTYERHGLRVELDRTKVFPDDPGRDTPAMVFSGDYSATYWCATGEGELTHWKDARVKRLSERQLNWLHDLDRELTDFLYDDREVAETK